jgi:hypothetical protein
LGFERQALDLSPQLPEVKRQAVQVHPQRFFFIRDIEKSKQAIVLGPLEMISDAVHMSNGVIVEHWFPSTMRLSQTQSSASFPQSGQSEFANASQNSQRPIKERPQSQTSGSSLP